MRKSSITVLAFLTFLWSGVILESSEALITLRQGILLIPYLLLWAMSILAGFELLLLRDRGRKIALGFGALLGIFYGYKALMYIIVYHGFPYEYAFYLLYPAAAAILLNKDIRSEFSVQAEGNFLPVESKLALVQFIWAGLLAFLYCQLMLQRLRIHHLIQPLVMLDQFDIDYDLLQVFSLFLEPVLKLLQGFIQLIAWLFHFNEGIAFLATLIGIVIIYLALEILRIASWALPVYAGLQLMGRQPRGMKISLAVGALFFILNFAVMFFHRTYTFVHLFILLYALSPFVAKFCKSHETI